MEKLRTYLNSLPPSEQAAYAHKSNTTIGYLRNALSNKKRLDGALCLKLDINSGGAVTKQSLRPDIWPELLPTKRGR